MNKNLRRAVICTFLFLSGLQQLLAETIPDSLKKCNFISEIREYIRTKTQLKINPDFYSVYAPGNELLCYVYVSRADTVDSGLSTPYSFFGNKELLALQCVSHYDSLGMHTLLYHTAGNSDARINHRLLEYDYTGIAFILFHEAVHQHLRNTGGKIPYNMEESLCDISGNYLSLLFARHSSTLRSRDVELQVQKMEKIYSLINSFYPSKGNTRKKLDGEFWHSCSDSLQTQLKSASLFLRDRYNYPINNAFLLRNSYYGKNYFLLRQCLRNKYHDRILTFLPFGCSLPADQNAVEVQLRGK